jgi:hypothetical protein
MDFINRMKPLEIAIVAAIMALFGFTMFGSNLLLALGLLAGSVYLTARAYDNWQTKQYEDAAARRQERTDYAPRVSGSDRTEQRRTLLQQDQVTRTPGAEPIYRHALAAVKAAGYDPDKLEVLPVDIGLLAFHENDEPAVLRSFPVPDNADYVQPFVQLRLPQRAVGKISFEIVDSDGQVVFVHQMQQALEKGRNLLSPPSRLRLHSGHNLRGRWELRVMADDTLLASHAFSWHLDDPDSIRQHINADGELSDELRASMAQARLDRLSLDDLLSDQDDDTAAANTSRRSSGR